MNRIKFVFLFFLSLSIFLTACQSVSKKIDEKTIKEEKELSKWLNKPESQLKITFGQPDLKTIFTSKTYHYIIRINFKFSLTLNLKFFRQVNIISVSCF